MDGAYIGVTEKPEVMVPFLQRQRGEKGENGEQKKKKHNKMQFFRVISSAHSTSLCRRSVPPMSHSGSGKGSRDNGGD